ncbi:antitoxin Xre/MbcA/ParS toxin-binding domain-containing protein [Sphingomonas elodea]|uniref:antitoxin Xre/MbcA/ParS toxin-binding domain-containing protein n=1 Tax=Sphingomonas elodea TaxID=179878 RepID=UPI0002631DB7|nr:antitoxin Xre/MbcA/ParS toxin-binding domain-containing protein [Sphingomonas elodea]
MSGAITRLEVGATSDEGDRRRFRGAVRSKLAPEVIARQSRIALLAFQRFPDRAAALAFLNSVDEALGGRPIDIASTSEAGAERIAAALRERDSAAMSPEPTIG